MKKNYTAPLATEVNVEAENMLAASSIGVGAGNVNPNNALTGGHRGSWGDLWE